VLNGADYIILIIASLSGIIGLWRGFVKEVFALVIWSASLLLSYFYYPSVSEIIPVSDTVNIPWIRKALAAALILICALICGGLVSAIVQKLVKITGLSGTDRVLGLVFGFARAATVIMLLLMILPATSPVSEQGWWQESLLIPAFLEFEDWARSVLEAVSIWFTTLLGGAKT